MARSHYVMDLFYPTASVSGRLRREVLRIEAESDDAARAEGQRIDSWRKTQFYQLRAIHNSSRAGDKVIYTSRVEDIPADPGTAVDDREPETASAILQGAPTRANTADTAAVEPLTASAPRMAKVGE